MTAYKKEDLDNRLVQQIAQEAFYSGLLNKEAYAAILEKHPYALYTPNFFVFIGLSLLTFIIGIFGGGLFSLMFLSVGGEDSIRALLVVLALMAYTALELIVNRKKHFNAGTDNSLMVLTVTLLLSALMFTTGNNVVACAVLFIVCTWMCYRFTDAFMGMQAYAFLMFWLYNFCVEAGGHVLAVAPFLLMAFSAIIYWVINAWNYKSSSLYYRKCINYIKLVTVIGFYVFANCYVARGIVNEFYNPYGKLLALIPLPWLFWSLTVIIPVVYIWFGVRAKSLLFLRCGVLAAAATIATIRYYHSILPLDVAFMLAGTVLIAVSWLLIKYLRTPKNGFVFGDNTSVPKELKNVEALIIAQVFKIKHAPVHNVEFGSGSSGGGGATGEY